MRVRVNGDERELAQGTTVAGLVESLGLRPDQVAVELNKSVVRRPEHARTELSEGDTVELVTLVGGG